MGNTLLVRWLSVFMGIPIFFGGGGHGRGHVFLGKLEYPRIRGAGVPEMGVPENEGARFFCDTSRLFIQTLKSLPLETTV